MPISTALAFLCVVVSPLLLDCTFTCQVSSQKVYTKYTLCYSSKKNKVTNAWLVIVILLLYIADISHFCVVFLQVANPNGKYWYVF